MTRILRLRGLDVKASTEDIRAFFKRINIPDGGVYIVGGRLREAFIAFTTERDAQLAMCHSGKTLKGSKVTLSKSSMEELEKRLKLLLKTKKPSSTKVSFAAVPQISPTSALQPTNPTDPQLSPPSQDPNILKSSPCPPHPITSNPQPPAVIDSSTAFLLGVCTVLGLQSSNEEASKASAPSDDKFFDTTISNEMRKPEQGVCLKSGYVRLFGLPHSATKELICHFFKGLEVQEVIVNVKLGLSSGCLVKFASEKEACRALLFNQQLLESNPIEVRGASEKMWTSALQECKDALGVGKSHESKKNPPTETVTCKPQSSVLLKRWHVDQLKHDSPKKQRAGSQSTASSVNRENWVLVKNLPRTFTKTEIKELLGCPNVAHKNVLHLLDHEGNRTDTCFILLTRVEDYEYAINLTGCHVGNNVIQVSATTELIMKDMMAKMLPRRAQHSEKAARVDGKSRSAMGTPRTAPDPTALTCLYVRNMPAGVTASQLKSLLCRYRLNKSKVTMLTDSSGISIGEAVVQFNSERLAALAQKLHGQHFLGSKLLLTRINVEQMGILANV